MTASPQPPDASENRRVELDVHAGVAHVRLVRAPHNAIDQAMTGQLGVAVDSLREGDGIRVVLITAEGRDLSVGGDLAALTAAGDSVGELLDEMIGGYHRTLTALADLPMPVVCALRGSAAGGALGLLWAADVVVAADDARLLLGFGALGLSGDGGSSWYLPRLVGLRRALDLAIDGRPVSAADALALGLVNRVVPAADLDREAADTAARLAAGPTLALAAIRRLYRRGLDRALEEQLVAEQAALVELATSDDGREGMRAFTERRPPDFHGR